MHSTRISWELSNFTSVVSSERTEWNSTRIRNVRLLPKSGSEQESEAGAKQCESECSRLRRERFNETTKVDKSWRFVVCSSNLRLGGWAGRQAGYELCCVWPQPLSVPGQDVVRHAGSHVGNDFMVTALRQCSSSAAQWAPAERVEDILVRSFALCVSACNCVFAHTCVCVGGCSLLSVCVGGSLCAVYAVLYMLKQEQYCSMTCAILCTREKCIRQSIDQHYSAII